MASLTIDVSDDELRGLDDEYRKQIGLIGTRLNTQNERIEKVLEENHSLMSRFDSSLLKGNGDHDGMMGSDSFRDALSSTIVSVRLTSGIRDLVQPLSDRIELISLDQNARDYDRHKQTMAVLMSIRQGIFGGFGESVLIMGKLRRNWAEFTEKPFWYLLVNSMSLLKNTLFGWSRETDNEKIVNAIDKLTQFMMTGEVDQRKGLIAQFKSGGLLKLASGLVTSAIGAGSGLAQRNEDALSVGMEREKSFASWIADKVNGDQVVRKGRTGGVLGMDRKVMELLKAIDSTTRDHYLFDAGPYFRLMSNDFTDLMGEWIDGQSDLGSTMEKNQKFSKKAYEQLLVIRRNSSMSLLARGLSGIGSIVKTVVAGVSGILTGVMTKALGSNFIKRLGTIIKSGFTTLIKKAGGAILGGILGFTNKKNELADRTDLTDTQKNAMSAVTGGGAALGTVVGGFLGSVLGPVGTVIGGVAGGVIGEKVGSAVANFTSEWFADGAPLIVMAQKISGVYEDLTTNVKSFFDWLMRPDFDFTEYLKEKTKGFVDGLFTFGGVPEKINKVVGSTLGVKTVAEVMEDAKQRKIQIAKDTAPIPNALPLPMFNENNVITNDTTATVFDSLENNIRNLTKQAGDTTSRLIDENKQGVTDLITSFETRFDSLMNKFFGSGEAQIAPVYSGNSEEREFNNIGGR